MASASRYFRAALLAPANVLGMVAAGVGSAVTGDPTALFAALGVEALYLFVVPQLRGFQRQVRRAADETELPEGTQGVQALLTELSPSQREHYEALRALRDRILENHRRLPGGRVLAASSEQQVDALLTSFVRMVSTLNGYRQYLNAADKRDLERELAALEQDAAAEDNARVRDVKHKRVDILRKRLERFQQAEESREVVSHQLAAIEDLLKLTHEQSISLRDPESVGRQLEALTAEVQSTEETVREMEKFLHLSEEVAPAVVHGTRVR